MLKKPLKEVEFIRVKESLRLGIISRVKTPVLVHLDI
jgi:hypothetical protein